MAIDPNAQVGVSQGTVLVGDVPTLATEDLFAIYIDDGDDSVDRVISIKQKEGDLTMWTLTLDQIDSLGGRKPLESWDFSLVHDAVDDMGKPAYLPVVLENNDSRMRAVVNFGAELPASWTGLTDGEFTGGYAGDYSKITADDYSKGLEVLGNSMVEYTAVLSLGCYDGPTLMALANHARDVRVDYFFDVPSTISPSQAIVLASGQGFGSMESACRYYFPYQCDDPFNSGKIAFGLSCDAFVAKSRGVAMFPSVGGWHLSPAGAARGVVARTGIKPLPAAAKIDHEAFVPARINSVGIASGGSVIIDDALTCWLKDDYQKYQHVSSLMNALARGIYSIGQALKHEPDGVTRSGLEREIPRLLRQYVATGALVVPRNPDVDGTEPFIVQVEQTNFDLWTITYSVCPTGVGRRIVGMPVLIA
ncbi:TPA: hypothetical protein JG832_002497 [Enterobacter hormaechei subsp. xiangfangensis]|nr:hypothetical protein [Enterobacter hormaechei subsp. xiangfangensis]HAV1890632.1 hypothetical protein [Enterobacter hormaechei subsp. xiangfangensis]